jgi:hypothetical protein
MPPTVTLGRRGSVEFPGLGGLERASYACSHGAAPGKAFLRVHPVPFGKIPWIGDLEFSDTTKTITVPDCRIVDAQEVLTPGGYRIVIVMEDHRWRWRFGSVNGEYNIPAIRVKYVARVAAWGDQFGNPPNGFFQEFPDQFTPQIQEHTRKSARELAAILASRMGEVVDVSALPNNQYPHVLWVGANPAKELESLCETYACRLVYDPFNGKVICARLGFGSALPDAPPGDIQADEYGMDPPEPPQAVVVYGAPIMWQQRFQTEPALMDFDGRIHNADDVSYRPALTWAAYGPNGTWIFQNINRGSNLYRKIWPRGLPGTRTGADVYHLASQWLFHAYRIAYTYPVNPFADPKDFSFPVDSKRPEDSYVRQDIALTDHTVEVTFDDRGEVVLWGGRAYGKTDFGGVKKGLSTTDYEEINVPFTVVPEHQVVLFQDPLYYTEVALDENQNVIRDSEGTPVRFYYFTRPVIEVAVTLRDPVNHAPIRYSKTYPIDRPARKEGGQSGGGRPGEQVFVADEIRFAARAHYGDKHEFFRYSTNREDCDRKAKFFADIVKAQYQLSDPHTRTYNGLVRGAVDGSIFQVSISVEPAPSGTTMTMSRNTEHHPQVDPYFVRRTKEEMSLDAIKRIKLLLRGLVDGRVPGRDVK